MGQFSTTVLEQINQYGIIPMRRTGSSAAAAVISLLQCDPEEAQKKTHVLI